MSSNTALGRLGQPSCPKCFRPMHAWQSYGLALDYCFSCKGLWFDAGELSRHLARSNALLDEVDVEPKGKTEFPCPRCRGVHLAQASVDGVTLDVCPRCRGIFLDLGEVHELLGAISRREYAAGPALAGMDDFALGLSIGVGLGGKPAA